MKTLTPSANITSAEKPSTTARTPVGRTFELLSLIKPSTDAVHGKWVRVADGIQCETSNYNRIEIPYHPPAEYDLSVQLTRQRGNSDIGVIFPAHGGQVELVLGGWDNTLCGLMDVDGVYVWDNSTRTEMKIEAGHKYDVLVQVRNDTIRVRLDGKPLFEFRSADAKFTLHENCNLRDDKALGFYCNGPTIFHSCSVVEGSQGTARNAESANPPPTLKNPTGSVAVFEKMGYSVKILNQGVSSHTNAQFGWQAIPREMEGKQFTQIVSGNSQSVTVKFLRPSRIYVLLNRSYGELYTPNLKIVKNIGKKEDFQISNGQGEFEVWSVDGKTDLELKFPAQLGIVADRVLLNPDKQ